MTPRDQAVSCIARALEIGEKDPAQYTQLLIAATKLDPSFSSAWFHLAGGAERSKMHEAANVLYRRAVACDPKNVGALVGTAHTEHWCGNSQRAIDDADKILFIDHRNHHAYIIKSLAYSALGEIEASLFHADFALALKDTADSHMTLAFAALFARDFARGLREHEWRYESHLPYVKNFPWPKWNGEDISDKTLYIFSDQGIGDAISFARFIPAAAQRAQAVEVQVNEELVKALSAALIDCPNVSVRPAKTGYPAAHVWTSFMSLPVPLGLTNEEIISCPDLPWTPPHIPPTFLNQNAVLNVGIVWAGNENCDIEKFRRVPLPLWRGILSIPGIQFHSLQVGSGTREMTETGMAICLSDLGPYIRDVSDTLGILNKLDLVISSDTSIIHMCAAIQKECWILASKNGGDFRIGRRPDLHPVLWAPNSKVFMQKTPGDWNEPLAEVARRLRIRAQEKNL